MKAFPNIFMRTRRILMIRLAMREIKSVKSKFYTILLISVLLTGILMLSSAISLLIDEWHIGIIGTVVYETHAESGSVEDIQAAVDKVVAKGGGTVHIPEGVFTFNASGSRRVAFAVPAGGLRIFGAGINRTVLQMPINDSAPNTVMFYVTGGYETVRAKGGWVSGGAFRFSGITLKGRSNIDTSPTGDVAIELVCARDFRIDHSSFYYMGAQGILIADHTYQYNIEGGDPDRVSQGVIDHCDFIDIHKPVALSQGRGYGYGVQISRAGHYLWTLWDDDIWNVLGVYDKNVFIEDSYFKGVRHAVASSSGGVYVLRNSIIEDLGMAEAATTGHPNRENYNGMRAHEIYNNTIRYTGTYGTRFYGVHMEGGGGVVFNNTIDNLIHAFRFGSCEVTDPDYHPRGHLGDMYVWDNTATNCDEIYYAFSNEPDGCPTPQEDVEYFLHAPPSERNYVPYPYPHPLTLE